MFMIVFFVLNITSYVAYIFLNPKTKHRSPVGNIWVPEYLSTKYNILTNYIKNNIKKEELSESKILFIFCRHSIKYCGNYFY